MPFAPNTGRIPPETEIRNGVAVEKTTPLRLQHCKPASPHRGMTMDRGMTCTECFRQTGVEPDFSGLPAVAVVELCRSWLCDDCLDAQEEREPGSTQPKDNDDV